MPRIPGPRTPGGPGPVIGAPRPREVSAARVTYGTVQPAPTMPALKSPLVDFGNTLSEIGLSVAEHIVQQERAAAQTKLQLSAVRQLGELENAVDAAGTASQARTIWDEQFPKIIGRLEKEANEVGLPEATGDLMLLGERSKISTRSAIAKRAAQEGADDAAALAAAYEERLAGARSEADFVGLRSELQRSLENTAQNNPLVSPGDADALLADTAQRGAVRRVGTLVDAAAANNDIAGLQGIQQQLSNLAAFTDLPADKRAALSASISDTIRQEEARRRAEAMRAGAIAASDLRIGIERADSPADLNAIIDRTEDLFGVGSLAPDTRASLVVAAERKKADLLEGQFELGNIMGRLALGFGLNSQKEADIAYAAEAQTVEPDQAAAHLVDFTTRAGIAPSQGTNLLARAERMEEPTQLATAAAYLRAVQDRSYAAASRMEVGERVASTMATAKVLGVPMEEAAQLIIDQGPDAAVRKSRREAFDAEFESWTPEQFLADHDIAPEFWFSADTEVGDRLAIETESAMRRVWEMTGNRAAAEQAAADMLQRRFAVTRVGGRPTLTEVAPEPYGAAMLQGMVDEEVISRAIDTEIAGLLSQAGVEPAPALEGMEDQPAWQLRADEQTRFERTQGRPPSFQLWVRGDEFGNQRPVRNRQTGEVVRYFMSAETLRTQPPVVEKARESFRGAVQQQIVSSQSEVRLLEGERLRLMPQASAGVPGAAERLTGIEARLDEARRRLGEAESRVGP